MLHQPDLLLAPSPGKLAAVFVYLPGTDVSWRSALAALEDLFEVKLYLGHNTLVVGVMLPDSGEETIGTDKAQLLRNTFDVFLTTDAWNRESQEDRIRRLIERSVPRLVFSELWSREKQLVHSSLMRFGEKKYRVLIEKEHNAELTGAEISFGLERQIESVLRLPLIRGYSQPNIKAFLGQLPREYFFEFDFGIQGRPHLAIEILTSGRYGSRERLRYLMTKGRLLRYVIAEGRIIPRFQDFHPILIVNGNIAGPDHDPYRYVRALISVGWEIIRADQVKRLPGIARRANL